MASTNDDWWACTPSECEPTDTTVTITPDDYMVGVTDLADVGVMDGITLSDTLSEQTIDVKKLHDSYEEISVVLGVISEIIDEIVEMYPEERERLSVQRRVEQKLMLRKLAGEDNDS